MGTKNKYKGQEEPKAEAKPKPTPKVLIFQQGPKAALQESVRTELRSTLGRTPTSTEVTLVTEERWAARVKEREPPLTLDEAVERERKRGVIQPDRLARIAKRFEKPIASSVPRASSTRSWRI